jgi:hypothetical protein
MRILVLIVVLFLNLALTSQKINGVNFVSPQNKLERNLLMSLNRINANWVAYCPYAFMKSGETYVHYNNDKNYWGDHIANLKFMCALAKKQGLKILIKPHIWVEGEGWPGDFSPGVGRWKIWQENYTKYVLELAQLCQNQGVDMLCIGTEFKLAVVTKPGYWKWLIGQVRQVYSGQLTYAANWDNYYNIPFWSQLDVIGIDAYFPLVNESTPTVASVEQAWNKLIPELSQFSDKQNKRIVFTECGYRSTNFNAYQQWLIESQPSDEKVNLTAQLNAYEGFYRALWAQDWLLGGFIWKWYGASNSGGHENSDYTPEHKPVERVIKKWYSE